MAGGFNPDFNVFGYLTLRAILGALDGAGHVAVAGAVVYPPPGSADRWASRFAQLGPESHFSKAGTPTMGGALILFAIVLATLLWSDLGNRYRVGGAAGDAGLRRDRLDR